jgi:putative ABC transport system substrate-binding protein
MLDMRRREFIAAVAGASLALPLAARAQQRSKLPTIGFLGTSTPAVWSPWVTPFVQRLHELGWIENRTVLIEYRWAQSRPERFPEIAAEFARLKVDIIVTAGIVSVSAAKQATSTIPVVFALMNDPISSGLVASLARPGRNVTGLSTQLTDLPGKRVGLLRELVPGLRRLAVLANVGFPDAVQEMREFQAAAKTLDLELAVLEIRHAEDIAPSLTSLNSRADVLYVCPDPLVFTYRMRISSLALNARLPMMSAYREFAEAGGVMSYGPNVPDLFRRAADFADRILRGAKPADIPVEQPTKFDLVINVTTTKALALTVPDKLLALADEVIE